MTKPGGTRCPRFTRRQREAPLPPSKPGSVAVPAPSASMYCVRLIITLSRSISETVVLRASSTPSTIAQLKRCCHAQTSDNDYAGTQSGPQAVVRIQNDICDLCDHHDDHLTSVSERSVGDALRRLANDLETGEFRRRDLDLQRRQEMNLGIRILTLLPRTKKSSKT